MSMYIGLRFAPRVYYHAAAERAKMLHFLHPHSPRFDAKYPLAKQNPPHGYDNYNVS